MPKQINVLWIDEETDSALSEIRSRLDNSISFNLKIIETSIAALEALEDDHNYDVIIVDIRIPEDNVGKNYKQSININSRHERNGLNLIKEVIERKLTYKMLIFTNESYEQTVIALGKHEINKKYFLQKASDFTPDDFIELIIEIYKKGNNL